MYRFLQLSPGRLCSNIGLATGRVSTDWLNEHVIKTNISRIAVDLGVVFWMSITAKFALVSVTIDARHFNHALFSLEEETID